MPEPSGSESPELTTTQPDQAFSPAEPDALPHAVDPIAAAAAPAQVAPRATFADLGLSEPILRAIHELDYLHPTPIQEQAIPYVLMGRDVLGTAQTGTGKTASFTLPMLDVLTGSRARARMPRTLILEPTRELALQVSENFVNYGKYLKLNYALIIGGESMNDQKDALTRGVDVLIATPGRLIDLIERGGILLSDTKLLVIDEADRMLDMGFIPDVERIVGLLPANRQTLFFSATMAPPIRRLADAFLSNPKEISVSRPASVATTIIAGLAIVPHLEKREALRQLLNTRNVQNALIFCNRKRDVDILYKSLGRHGFSVGALHGDMTQPMRFATLEKFKAGELRLLVCSDVAARGLDIGGLSHVFNFDVPIHAEDYVHRIGRTGRAEREGHAYTLASPDDKLAVDAIETLIGMPIPHITVPGMAQAHWAEGGETRHGRSSGRGRGGGRAAEAKPRASEAKPRAAEAKPRPSERASERPSERLSERAAGRPSRPPRAAARSEGRSAEATPSPEASAAPPPPRVTGLAGPARRDASPAEDPGGRVLGFGADIPAFMLLRRAARHARIPDGDTADAA